LILHNFQVRLFLVAAVLHAGSIASNTVTAAIDVAFKVDVATRIAMGFRLNNYALIFNDLIP